MPLTPALQARLKKRGIVSTGTGSDNTNNEDNNSAASIGVVKGCPNRNNPYHKCVEYCHTRWGSSDPTQAPHIKDYCHVPLPPGWYFIPEHTSGKHYYWNTTTNQVSWLHPLDPSAEITLPATVVNKQQSKDNKIEPNREIPSPLVTAGDTTQEKEQSLSVGKHPSLVKGSQKRQEMAEKRKLNEKEAKTKRNRTELDPMDPAAYSDTPRGDWSTGLQQKGDAKTGADVTASGPLFQQRPYPSPGAVLRQNQKLAAGGAE